MINKKMLIISILIFTLIFSGCAGIFPLPDTTNSDDPGEKFMKSMSKYTDPLYLGSALSGKPYHDANYLKQMAEKRRIEDGTQDDYINKMKVIGVVTLVGITAGALIGYNDPANKTTEIGDARIFAAVVYGLIGAIPGLIMFGVVQLGEMFNKNNLEE